MGLLDQLAGGMRGQTGDTEPSSPTAMLDVIMGLINQHESGLAGLLSQFQKGGMNDIVNSWVGRGANLPVSAEQIQAILGNEQISSIASRLGLDAGVTASGLAQFLPLVVDKLTPNGSIEPEQPLNAAGLEMIKDVFR